jgi:hydroxymethylpyrimidine pyrophosphatase-like HAD family hydrolase
MGLSPKDFFAIGDGANDIQMLELAGRGVTIANAHPATKAAVSDVMEEGYGMGFVQAVKKYLPYLRAR